MAIQRIDETRVFRDLKTNQKRPDSCIEKEKHKRQLNRISNLNLLSVQWSL